MNVTGLVSGIPASSPPLENLQVISSCSSTSGFNGDFSLTMESDSDTASLPSKAFENSILGHIRLQNMKVREKTNFGRLAKKFQICSIDADILS